MANEKEPEPGTRGWRIDAMRKRLEMSKADLAAALAVVAKAEGLNGGGKWTPSRVSRTILGRKPIPLDDVAAVVLLARDRGLDDVSWDWVVFGRQAPKAKKKPVEVRYVSKAPKREEEPPADDAPTDTHPHVNEDRGGKRRHG